MSEFFFFLIKRDFDHVNLIVCIVCWLLLYIVGLHVGYKLLIQYQGGSLLPVDHCTITFL